MKRRALVKAGLALGSGAFIARKAWAQGGTLNLYSARHYKTDEALYGNFADLTGVKINRVDAEPDPLIQRLRTEGDKSPCDVFITVDAGRIERAREMGLLQATDSAVLAKAIPAHLRDPDNTWFGFSKRARVIMYAKDRVKPEQLSTYEDLASPKWKGKIVTRSSTNIYQQSWTGSMMVALGMEGAETWAKGLVANFARPPKGGDRDQIAAVAAGEADIAVANTYYLAGMLMGKDANQKAQAEKIGVFFPNQKDRGTHVNISGGGVAKNAPNKANAIKFLEYLVTLEAQAYFAEGNYEYPVVADAKVAPVLSGWGRFKDDQLNAQVFAKYNTDALKIMDRAGWK